MCDPSLETLAEIARECIVDLAILIDKGGRVADERDQMLRYFNKRYCVLLDVTSRQPSKDTWERERLRLRAKRAFRLACDQHNVQGDLLALENLFLAHLSPTPAGSLFE